MKNTGKSIYKIKRHLVTISSIRDKSLHLASRLFSCTLALSCAYDSDGAQVCLDLLTGKEEGEPAARQRKARQVVWKALRSDPTWQARTALLLRQLDVLSPLSPLSLSASSLSVSSREPLEEGIAALPLAFPCIVLRAKFDQFSIVHATQLFTAVDICAWSEGAAGGGGDCPVFCCEDIYELCSSAGHVPGAPLPLQLMAQTAAGAHADSRRPASFNMVLPVAHTPLLFELYKGMRSHSLN